METIIKKILEMDEQARQMKEQAEHLLENSKDAIAARVREIEENYKNSVDEIMEMAWEDEQGSIEQARQDIDAKTEASLLQLKQSYALHSADWEAQMFAHMIGPQE